MDSGISDMISSVLSNPDALNKIMTMAPAVAQMMNGGGSNNPNQDKIVETTAVNKSDASNMSTESLMANAEVADALKNLITALNAASAVNNAENKDGGAEDNQEVKEEAVMTSAPASPQMEEIASMLGSMAKPQGNNSGTIEKTLDTLKNFSSVTSPESDHRLKLLLALKPFLKDGRKTKIDTAIKYMNAAKIITMFGKNGFV